MVLESNITPQNTYHRKHLIIQQINEEIIADLESIYKRIVDQAKSISKK